MTILINNLLRNYIYERNSCQTNKKSKIKKIVADHLGIEEEKVTEEASFIDDLGADSLDTVELVMAFRRRIWFRNF